MKTLVAYYSQTGNNAALAQEVASRWGAATHAIVEVKPRTMMTTILDMTFGRHPKLTPVNLPFEEYEFVLLMGPLWMFQLASPLRSFCRQAKGQIGRYGFISVCGGALGPNTSIAKELVRRLGKSLAFHLELPAAHFGTVDPEPRVEETKEYHLADHPNDRERMANLVEALVKGLNR